MLHGHQWWKCTSQLLQVIMLSSITELHSYIDRTQLTQELGGTQEYCHEKWISHRTVRTALHLPTRWWGGLSNE